MFRTKSWWRRMFAVVAVGILAFTAAPATAASADWDYGQINSGLPPGWCLSTNRTAYPGFPTNTAAVYTTTCDARNDFHLWAVAEISGSKPWQIANKGAASCLSMNLQPAPGGNANTRAVYTVWCSDSIYQLWYWGSDNKIRNYATGWCLSTNLTPHPGSPSSTHAVYATNCSTTAAHTWGYLPA
jgi:hypothetical protein